MRSSIVAVTLTCVTLGSGCASAPAIPAAVAIPLERKTAWLLQLEDQRILRLPEPPPPAATPGRASRRAAPAPVASSSPDLSVLIKDADARVRRRAALAIGRVGLPEGVPLLSAALDDSDPDVRAMAAFGLGLLGDASAEAALATALSDPVPLVRGRAAEALGLIGAKGSAAAVGKVAAEYGRSPAVTSLQPDDETWPGPPEAEAFKLSVFALVRLRAYDALASAVLEAGRPIVTWWPVAYALQRIEDPRAAPALRQLLTVPGRYTRAFAARGLGSLKHSAAAADLIALLDTKAKTPLEVMAAAIRALAAMGATSAGTPLASMAAEPGTHPNLRLEAVTALGVLRADDGLPVVQDLMTDPWPALRSAALRAAAAINQDSFIAVLSGMERDRDWRVRAVLAEVLGTLPADIALERVRSMLDDEDRRALPSVFGALRRLGAQDIGALMLERLTEEDFVIRSVAANHVGELKPAGGAAALREAYTAGLPDSAYGARAAALRALAGYGVEDARETLTLALADKDWAVRLRAAELLQKLDPESDSQQAIRPAPGVPPVPYEDPLLSTPDFSPHAFIETARGTIEIELAVLDAPQTTRNFMALARKGFFNGLQVHRVEPNFVVQDGDPRGDGQGGPGYTIRDELNDRPFLRGTVGMALAGRDTGGSQFFIAHSPQPHLDAMYTVFGHVVNGMEFVDRLQQGDVIERIRIWDGKGWE